MTHMTGNNIFDGRNSKFKILSFFNVWTDIEWAHHTMY